MIFIESEYTEDEITLGIIYYQGRGVEKDVDKAVSYYLRAARHGDSNGLLLMGLVATKEGNAEAQYYLGEFLAEGRLVPKNYEKAVNWLSKAAEQDYTQAQYMLGKMYYEGKGVWMDKAKGLRLLNIASEKGYKPATDYLRERGEK